MCWRPAALMPESSEGSSVPFFTFTSSFSRAAAPCWPPFTRFHFIRLFWNQTFTFTEERQNQKIRMGSLKVIMIFLAVAQCFTFFFLMMCKTLLFCLYNKENSKHAKQFWIGREPCGCEDNDCKGGKGVTARRQLDYLQQTAPQEALRALQKTLQRSRTLEKYIILMPFHRYRNSGKIAPIKGLQRRIYLSCNTELSLVAGNPAAAPVPRDLFITLQRSIVTVERNLF